MKKAKEILELLNTVDENTSLEAKKGSAIDKSILETINAFSNEPNLEGGLIVLGIEKEEDSLFPSYVVTGVEDLDKLQSDLATQCATAFNFPIRPRMEVETIGDKNILKVEVDELPEGKKPLVFEKLGIPKGIYRRVGPTDQQCTVEDLPIFFGQSQENYDTTIIPDSSLDDINEDAVELYRKHLRKINPSADVLDFDNEELLNSLFAITKQRGEWKVTLTGLLVFGKKSSLRRYLPMCRVDYIRVSGKEWIENPDERFESTIDMRGSLLELLPRIIAAIADDLPKGFYLPEGSLQSETDTRLPYKVLREAIVNALIHRSYRVNRPIQIIRYSNRIEIINAGYSLKSIESIGEPGSVPRNPHIASIFHDTNLAETKGSGIKSMRKLLAKSQMMPPTFESVHTDNSFTLRLLLHHLINEQDHIWLSKFDAFQLNDEQKTALIFLREVGALDNQSYRQLTGASNPKSSADLRKMASQGIITQKGASKKHTYYVPSKAFTDTLPQHLQTLSPDLGALSLDLKPLSPDLEPLSVESGALSVDLGSLSVDLLDKIKNLGKRSNPKNLEKIILELCLQKPCSLEELAQLLGRTPKHLREEFINKLMRENKLEFTIPQVVNHPKQAYKTKTDAL